MDTNEFGQAVKARRKEEKMSQQVLAEKVGISRNYLSQIERGQSTNLSWQLRQRLTEVLGLQEEDTAGTTDATDDVPESLKEFAKSFELFILILFHELDKFLNAVVAQVLPVKAHDLEHTPGG